MLILDRVYCLLGEKIATTALRSILALCLIACTEPLPIPTAPIAPTVVTGSGLGQWVITAKNAHQLQEIQTLISPDAGVVAGLKFAPDLTTLLAAYAGEGRLRHWQLPEGEATRVLGLGIVGLGAVSFSADGRMIATGAGAEWEKHAWDDDYYGWQIRDTISGEVIKGSNNEYAKEIGFRELIAGIALQPDAKYVLMIGAGPEVELRSFKSLYTHGVTITETGETLVDFSRLPEEDDFDVIAFDALGRYFAAADESGKVAVYLFDPPKYPRRPQTIEEVGRHGARPLALAFDPGRHWLARVRGTELAVWDLQSWNYQRQIALLRS